jgi:urease gamma subunit
MANIIQIKRSTGSSAPTGLAAGEMAWYDGGGGSGANGKLFVGDVADGTAQHIGGRGTGAIGGGAASSLAADDLSAGDAAVTISTTSGNITVDATANNSDIIFKGTDATADITMLTLDGSEAGAATFNNKVVATQLDIGSGGADIDGALEANSYTVAGVALNEYIADTAGAMFSSNTESGITATYQDADNTIDLTVGTLNQNTTGSAATLTTARTIGGVSFNGSANIALVSGSIPDNAADTTGLAATATALATARTIGGVSFDGSANIALVSGSIPNNAADTTGLAATATKIASITNSNIVQLTETQTLTNKTLTSPTLTGPALGTPASGTLTNCTFPSANVNTDVDVSVSNLETRLAAIDTATTIGNGVTMTAGGDFTVTGDLIVSGDTTTVNTATLSVEDPLIILASGNGADTVDVGLYAKYTASGVKYAGIVRDASVTGDPWTFFDSLTTEPTTTVTVGANGFDYADIKAGAIDAEDGFTGNLTGNASGSSATCTGLAATATALATARNIGGVSFDGTGNISLVSGSIPNNAADTTGLAATATALATARTIGGVSFDGSANIALVSGSIPNNAADTTGLAATATALATARTIGGVSFNGSANIDLPGVNSAGNQATSGLAATATILATARNIGGVSFNGSANIDLPGVNSAGNQATSSTSAGLSGTPNIAVGTVATTTLTASTAIKLGDSDDLIFGAGSDIIMSHEGSAASADAEIAGRIEGTSDHLGYTANSLVISNITDDGDIAFFVSDGGNSMGQLKLTAADNKVRIGGGAALEGEGSTTLNGFTIDGGTF